MIDKFRPEIIRESVRKPNRIVSVKLPPELVEPFYQACRDTGLSPSRFGAQCIKFALDRMEIVYE